MKKPPTDAQQKLIKLDMAKAAIDKYYEELQQAIEEVEKEVGLDGMFQAEDGVVYQIVKPAGIFVAFRERGYVRTKRADEKAGTLSVKKAQESGFTVG